MTTMEARPKAFLANSRLLRWWMQWVRGNRLLASRESTMVSRIQLNVRARAFAAWDRAVSLALREQCEHLSEQIAMVAEAGAELEQEQDAETDARKQGELAREEIAEEVERKTAEAAALRSQIAADDKTGTVLLERLEEARETADALAVYLRLRAAPGLADDCARSPLCALRQDPTLGPLEGLEKQLAEVLDIGCSLRFAVRKGEAEAREAMQARSIVDAQAAKLRKCIEELKRGYSQTMEDLDRKAAAVALEAEEAQQVAQNLEKALASMSFRKRMCDLELQRWQS